MNAILEQFRFSSFDDIFIEDYPEYFHDDSLSKIDEYIKEASIGVTIKNAASKLFRKWIYRRNRL